MSKKSPYHYQNEEKELEKIFRELSGDASELESINEGRDETEEIEVSPLETEEALISLKEKLGFNRNDVSVNKKLRDHKRYHAGKNYKFYLIAAVILIAVGIGYFLMPVNKTVPYGETATLELPDGSRVTMNSGTKIKYNFLFGVTNRKIQLNGEAYFEVEPSNDLFIVEANGANIEVTGTEFNVYSWDTDPGSATIVTVASGTVQFYPVSLKSEGITLTKGLSSSWYPGAARPTDPAKIDLQDVTAWKANNLSFIGQPLILIFKEIERKFNVDIEIQDEQIGKELLTTFYTAPQNVENLLDDITTVKGLNYRETVNGYVIFNQNNSR
jgi:ferric-dicitrate binding protein FerR (iron transport regulator)